jgi:hypothetical protein
MWRQSRLDDDPPLHLLRLLPFLCDGHRQLALENLALRQQLAVDRGTAPRPRLRPTDRLWWVVLARVWTGWRQPLVIVTDTGTRIWTPRSSAIYGPPFAGQAAAVTTGEYEERR